MWQILLTVKLAMLKTLEKIIIWKQPEGESGLNY